MGETYSIQGTVDYVIYNVLVMKDPIYEIRMMAYGGRLLADDTRKETLIRWKKNGENVVKKFKYKMPFDWNFSYCHAFDDHQNLRHALA